MKSVEETYVMMSQIEHVLKRPDTYIGSITSQESDEWVFEQDKIVKKNVKYTPGFLKIVDEAITNATDHSKNHPEVTKIVVKITDDGEISVMNNGPGIPVVVHSKNKMYIPEMIFGNLLTGSNYDDTEKRKGAGKNGIGIKATAIFSKHFKVETVDSINKKKFTQVYKDNLSYKSKPKVTDFDGKSYTKVTFTPDYTKFGMNGLDKDSLSILKKRVYDCVACTGKNVSIYFNDVKIKGKGLVDYAKYFSNEEPLACEENEGWEYLVFKGQNYDQVSFVNGTNTKGGGKHVDYIMNQIINSIKVLLEKKTKDQEVKHSFIKENFFIFLNASVHNPNFNSQTKEVLTTPFKDLGVGFKISDKFVKKIFNSSIASEILETIAFKNRKKMDKDVTCKKSSISVKNLEDAHNAGTRKSKETTLILTEGLSASSFAVAGLSVVGRANYGIYSLKGKVLNIREATQSQLLKNEEIAAIKKIMGLSHSKKYETEEEFSTLRYGSIGILADSDLDGVHITSLIMNFIHYWWPHLIMKKNFIKTIRTPIIKLKSGKIVKKFYNEKEYQDFISTSNVKWITKYYKGLGTSSAEEAKETFKDLKNNTEIYICDEQCDSSFKLAFEKKKADDRKEWLRHIPTGHAIRDRENQITYSDYINKELIYFSNYDNVRSIPNVMDGLKPSQRKVLYTALKKNITKEIKVAQFGSSVAEFTSYHHGEVSLSMAIIGMAQNYCGSNNINLLEPCGNFGYRNHNGKDAASPRYIFTHLSKNAQKLFNKEDDEILEYNQDDGNKIEPKFYTPSIPIVLVNGAIGIGTGYSTNIPLFNPKDICDNIERLLDKKEMKEMVPWYNGFKGTVVKQSETSYLMQGSLKKLNKNTLIIEEIPITTSISEYKEFLETFTDFIITNESTENEPKFTLKFKDEKALVNYDHKTLKLQVNINTSNMHLFTPDGVLKKYKDANEIIVDFVKCKLEFLSKRRENLLLKYKDSIDLLSNKKRFLEGIMDGKIKVYRVKKTDIEKVLNSMGFLKIDDAYDYLTSTPIYSFNQEHLQDLQKKIENTKKLYKETEQKSNITMLKSDLIFF